jgi:tetratricopeptide (TPR) repeat protein
MRQKHFKAMLLVAVLGIFIDVEGIFAQGADASTPRTVSPRSGLASLSRQAQNAIDRGEWPAAISVYEKLVKSTPTSAELQLNLGIAYFSSGQPTSAVAPLRRALRLKPALTQARQFLGAALADSGECKEALSYITKDVSRVASRELKRTINLAGVRCSMRLNQPDGALDFIQALNQEFPDDPEVLYLTVHFYSDLSIRAAQGLLLRAPSSYQVRLLNAEALETQGRWDEAAAEYRQVLALNPNLQGIHYRLGRLLLSAPNASHTAVSEARSEFQEELRVDANNAGASYILGELSRRDRQWLEAVEHFARAAKLDLQFADAFIGLGRSLIASRRFADAVAPLEAAVKLQPHNPVAHYHLGIAYSRVGRKEEAERESAAFRETSEKSRQTKQDVHAGILGPQKAEP